jgi:hypothetical protein
MPSVLIGGWAISAFQTRFTTDVDMVIPETALKDYDKLLRDRGYTKEADDDVSNVYEGDDTEDVGEKRRQFNRV